MHKPLRIATVTATCAVAGAVLYTTGAASAGQSTANSTHEPYNIGVLAKDIDAYYGTTLDADAKKQIDRAARTAHHKHTRPAVVFDIDDTLLLSLDYEKKNNYGYDGATWAAYVDRADRPAVPGSPELA